LNDVNKLQATQKVQQQSIAANHQASVQNQQVITVNTDLLAEHEKAIQQNQQQAQSLASTQQQHAHRLDALDQSIASNAQQAQTTLNDVNKLQATQKVQQQSIAANHQASVQNQQVITVNTDLLAEHEKAIQQN
ncbi:hypothetical protein, partial [Vibrio sinaloensis]|uniref:hypothetical protein n=1 Tax=Photobacterium sp. (strain ATCC 43367) TaxID=379097 RepID=UPI002F42D1BA